MTLLQSAMAFAVVMIIFSTLVTGIVEAILRFQGTREKNLQRTVEALFDRVVWPRLGASLAAINVENTGATDNKTSNPDELMGEHMERFVRDLTDNPVIEPDDKYGMGKASRVMGKLSKIDALSLLSFAERLGRSNVGKVIAAESGAQVDLLVKDLARGFDRFGRAASEVFRKKAQLTAICVAIPFAWMANIDAARLLDQLISNPEIATSLIEQAENVNKDNQDSIKSMEKPIAEIKVLQAAQESGKETPPSNDPDELLKELTEASPHFSPPYYCGDAMPHPA